MGKKSAPPPAPDYSQLATQQAGLNKEASLEQTRANRPNQITPWGSVSWSSDPNGNWSQQTKLNPKDQALLDQFRAFQGQQQSMGKGLLDKAAGTLGDPLSFDGMPGMSGYDTSALPNVDPNSIDDNLGPMGNIDLSQLSAFGELDPNSVGFGAVESVRDAMMSRMAPDRGRQREAALQRLRNQGISENSEAFQREMKRLDEGDTDANQQALLGATSAYGDIFNRGLSAAQYANAVRGQQLGEQGVKAGLDNENRQTQFGNNAQIQAMLAALRGQQFGEQGAEAQLSGQQRQQGISEREMIRQSPLNDFMKLIQGTNPNSPNMPSFMAGTGYSADDQYGAAKDQYGAAMGGYNAGQARGNSLMSGLFGLGGAALGGPLGAKAGSFLGGLLGD